MINRAPQWQWLSQPTEQIVSEELWFKVFHGIYFQHEEIHDCAIRATEKLGYAPICAAEHVRPRTMKEIVAKCVRRIRLRLSTPQPQPSSGTA